LLACEVVDQRADAPAVGIGGADAGARPVAERVERRAIAVEVELRIRLGGDQQRYLGEVDRLVGCLHRRREARARIVDCHASRHTRRTGAKGRRESMG
jgi:hypothetical protein